MAAMNAERGLKDNTTHHLCVAGTLLFHPAKLLLCVFVACMIVCSPVCESLPFQNCRGIAYAATWPIAGASGSVAIAFGETYQLSGKSLTHSGIDIEASAGSAVAAPCAGVVSFVGAVPAAEASGGSTMTAVSVKTADGRRITLMPLEAVDVGEGDVVDEGQVVGILAAGGDKSLESPHLHMGLKRDGVYYDPMGLFGAVGDSVPDAEDAGAALSLMPDEAAADMTVVPVEVGSSKRSAQSEKEPAFGTVTSGDLGAYVEPVQESAGVSLLVFAVALQVIGACASQFDSLCGALGATVQESGLVLMAGIFLCVLALTVFAALFVGHAALSIRRRGYSWKEIKNALLCRFFGGDSMHKLFPAPGTSFITRGRLAQRR